MTREATTGAVKQHAARFSVVSNISLTLFKLVVYVATGSVSILSEALHSGLDLVAAVMAFLAVRKSGDPADAEHQFGHGKFESLSGLAEGALIIVAVVMIAMSAMHRLLIRHAPLSHPYLGMIVMGVSAVINLFVSRMLFRVSRKTDSVALAADAWHLRTDVWTSTGVLAGMAAIGVGRRLHVPGIDLLDPIIALGVALVIAKAAWDIMAQSWGHLVDRSLPPEELSMIESLLQEHYPEIAGFHQLRTRKAGSQRYIDLHVVVPGEESVADAHVMCDHLENDLKALLPEAEVLIHVEPRGSGE
ncbi:MAG: cation diffusion facilitator family transporter [Armatimonadota bacterium]|jgi:cation diffusion facilitator family transporter